MLKSLSLQGCSSITDQAIWCLLLHKPRLQFLRYHQAYSVAEVLCRECIIFKPPLFLPHIEDDVGYDNEGEGYLPSQKRTKLFHNERLGDASNQECEKNIDENQSDMGSAIECEECTKDDKKDVCDNVKLARKRCQEHNKKGEFSESRGKHKALRIPQFDLRIFDHPFPYGLSLSSEVIKQVSYRY